MANLTYTDEIGEEICLKISTSGKGIQRLCKENSHWPCYQTIYEWRIKVKRFGEMYAKAKRNQVELLVDQCLDISDDSGFDATINESGKAICNSEAINRARLRVDTRKWLAAKLEPRIYGDKVFNDATVTVKQEDAIKELE